MPCIYISFWNVSLCLALDYFLPWTSIIFHFTSKPFLSVLSSCLPFLQNLVEFWPRCSMIGDLLLCKCDLSLWVIVLILTNKLKSKLLVLCVPGISTCVFTRNGQIYSNGFKPCLGISPYFDADLNWETHLRSFVYSNLLVSYRGSSGCRLWTFIKCLSWRSDYGSGKQNILGR